ncbi:MAG: proton-conducting transporter membrane subunit [Anaerolineaceae bacterium]
MSAPFIWVIFPLLVSIGLWFVQTKSRLVFILSLIICTLLGLAALLQPIGGVIKFGLTSVEIKTTLILLGRSFVLENSDRFFLVFINFSSVFWFLGSRISATPNKFIPLGLAITSLLTAALAVEPFLYSSVLIELAVIISLPMLINHGTPIGKGVLRYLIYQSLAMPFILLAGWILSGSQANPSDTSLLQIAALLLGMGFAFWLAVFPFHVWIPELASETHSFVTGFLLGLLPPVYLLILLKYLNGLVWLKDSAFLVPTLQTVGAVMIVTGGIWAAIQTNLKRIFGFVVIMQSGFSLICISLQSQQGLELFYISLIPHLLSLGVFAYALTCIERNQMDVEISKLSGSIRTFPFLFSGIIASLFSIIGLPIFAGFALNVGLLQQLSGNTPLISWLLIGYACLMVASLRLLIILIGKNGEKWTITESPGDLFFLIAGIFSLILMGIFPSVFIGGIWKLFASLLTLT